MCVCASNGFDMLGSGHRHTEKPHVSHSCVAAAEKIIIVNENNSREIETDSRTDERAAVKIDCRLSPYSNSGSISSNRGISQTALFYNLCV